MKLFDEIRKKRVDSIVNIVNRKYEGRRYFYLMLGSLIVAFSFNLFFLRCNIVCFGVSGVAIVLSEFGVNPSLFILLANISLMVVAYFVLGFDNMKNRRVSQWMITVNRSLVIIFVLCVCA